MQTSSDFADEGTEDFEDVLDEDLREDPISQVDLKVWECALTFHSLLTRNGRVICCSLSVSAPLQTPLSLGPLHLD